MWIIYQLSGLIQHTLVIETKELTKEFDARIADEPVSRLDAIARLQYRKNLNWFYRD
jgi:hypothetical protein